MCRTQAMIDSWLCSVHYLLHSEDRINCMLDDVRKFIQRDERDASIIIALLVRTVPRSTNPLKSKPKPPRACVSFPGTLNLDCGSTLLDEYCAINQDVSSTLIRTVVLNLVILYNHPTREKGIHPHSTTDVWYVSVLPRNLSILLLKIYQQIAIFFHVSFLIKYMLKKHEKINIPFVRVRIVLYSNAIFSFFRFVIGCHPFNML